MKRKTIVIVSLSVIVIAFLTWRLVRPMNIYIVTDKIAWPVDTTKTPAVLGNLSAEECGACHGEFYKEWKTAMHSQAWTDPYFQADWQFDSKQDSCRLCHTPLDKQQPNTVLGYRDANKWVPIVEDNPDFDPKLQHEGVTCAACHYRDGKIVGVLGNTDAPHPVKKLDDPNQVCVRCHVVGGEEWGTFFKFPPCGTVAEINSTISPDISPVDSALLATLQPLIKDKDIFKQNALGRKHAVKGQTGEAVVSDTASLGCVQCHMPVVERALVKGGKIRKARHHYWRGGHDPEMVKKSLSVKFAEQDSDKQQRRFALTLANTGAAHYAPTGTPDRYFSVRLRVLDKDGNVIDEDTNNLKRYVMWRPFIVDLKDTRLPRWQPRTYTIDISDDDNAASVEATIRYHLLDEKRRKRINYQNTTPIDYNIFTQTISLENNKNE